MRPVSKSTLKTTTLSIILLAGLAACSPSPELRSAGSSVVEGTRATAGAIGETGRVAAGDVAEPIADAASAAVDTAVGVKDATVMRATRVAKAAEIMTLPRMQKAWVVASEATLLAEHDPNFDPKPVRSWEVQLADGRRFTVEQPKLKLATGQEIMLIRTGKSLLILP